MGVEWKPVVGYEGLYEVSGDGLVRSLSRMSRNQICAYTREGRVLKPTLCNGYPRVTLADSEGRQRKEYIHRIACTAFHGEPRPGQEVAHADGDRLNPSAGNLRWASRQENIWDKDGHGTQPRGEQIWIAKLTEDQVRQIRRSTENQQAMADKLGVSRVTISNIRTRHTWKHVGA